MFTTRTPLKNRTNDNNIDQPSKSVEKSPKRFSARKSVKESLANVKAKLSQIEQSIHRELGSSQSDNKNKPSDGLKDSSCYTTNRFADGNSDGYPQLHIDEVVCAYRENEDLTDEALCRALSNGFLFPDEFRKYVRAFKNPNSSDIRCDPSDSIILSDDMNLSNIGVCHDAVILFEAKSSDLVNTAAKAYSDTHADAALNVMPLTIEHVSIPSSSSHIHNDSSLFKADYNPFQSNHCLARTPPMNNKINNLSSKSPSTRFGVHSSETWSANEKGDYELNFVNAPLICNETNGDRLSLHLSSHPYDNSAILASSTSAKQEKRFSFDEKSGEVVLFDEVIDDNTAEKALNRSATEKDDLVFSDDRIEPLQLTHGNKLDSMVVLSTTEMAPVFIETTDRSYHRDNHFPSFNSESQIVCEDNVHFNLSFSSSRRISFHESNNVIQIENHLFSNEDLSIVMEKLESHACRQTSKGQNDAAFAIKTLQNELRELQEVLQGELVLRRRLEERLHHIEKRVVGSPDYSYVDARLELIDCTLPSRAVSQTNENDVAENVVTQEVCASEKSQDGLSKVEVTISPSLDQTSYVVCDIKSDILKPFPKSVDPTFVNDGVVDPTEINSISLSYNVKINDSRDFDVVFDGMTCSLLMDKENIDRDIDEEIKVVKMRINQLYEATQEVELSKQQRISRIKILKDELSSILHMIPSDCLESTLYKKIQGNESADNILSISNADSPQEGRSCSLFLDKVLECESESSNSMDYPKTAMELCNKMTGIIYEHHHQSPSAMPPLYSPSKALVPPPSCPLLVPTFHKVILTQEQSNEVFQKSFNIVNSIVHTASNSIIPKNRKASSSFESFTSIKDYQMQTTPIIPSHEMQATGRCDADVTISSISPKQTVSVELSSYNERQNEFAAQCDASNLNDSFKRNSQLKYSHISIDSSSGVTDVYAALNIQVGSPPLNQDDSTESSYIEILTSPTVQSSIANDSFEHYSSECHSTCQNISALEEQAGEDIINAMNEAMLPSFESGPSEQSESLLNKTELSESYTQSIKSNLVIGNDDCIEELNTSAFSTNQNEDDEVFVSSLRVQSPFDGQTNQENISLPIDKKVRPTKKIRSYTSRLRFIPLIALPIHPLPIDDYDILRDCNKRKKIANKTNKSDATTKEMSCKDEKFDIKLVKEKEVISDTIAEDFVDDSRPKKSQFTRKERNETKDIVSHNSEQNNDVNDLKQKQVKHKKKMVKVNKNKESLSVDNIQNAAKNNDDPLFKNSDDDQECKKGESIHHFSPCEVSCVKIDDAAAKKNQHRKNNNKQSLSKRKFKNLKKSKRNDLNNVEMDIKMQSSLSVNVQNEPSDCKTISSNDESENVEPLIDTVCGIHSDNILHSPAKESTTPALEATEELKSLPVRRSKRLKKSDDSGNQVNSTTPIYKNEVENGKGDFDFLRNSKDALIIEVPSIPDKGKRTRKKGISNIKQPKRKFDDKIDSNAGEIPLSTHDAPKEVRVHDEEESHGNDSNVTTQTISSNQHKKHGQKRILTDINVFHYDLSFLRR